MIEKVGYKIETRLEPRLRTKVNKDIIKNIVYVPTCVKSYIIATCTKLIGHQPLKH